MKRKTQTRLAKKTSVIATSPTIEGSQNIKSMSRKTLVALLALILVIGLGALTAKKNKSLFIVGKVNDQYVTRLELEKAMNDRYAKSTFDDLVSTVLLKQLAKKNNIVVSADEIKKEVESTETRLGGKEALQSTLERLGYTQIRFEEEMRVQVLVRKLAEKQFKTEVTDQEVAGFYNDNKTLFPDKKLDEVKLEILQNLTEQKLQQQFSTWFQEEKGKATVKSYL